MVGLKHAVSEVHGSYYEVVRHILLDNWRHFCPKPRPARIGDPNVRSI